MSPGTIDQWHPVTHDYGLIRAPLADVVREFVDWQDSIGVPHVQRLLESGLACAFAALEPLSASKRRGLFVATSSAWTAFFQSGIQGSDPFPAMSFLAQRMAVHAMRVCCTPEGAAWPATIWEVYAPNHGPLGHARTICAANDGGRWTFEQAGEPYPFEDLSVYQRRRKRDRFNREILEGYLRNFGIRPFEDDFLIVGPAEPAVVVERGPWPNEPRGFLLSEVIDGLPWKGT
jgi:hypothetical protein